MDIYQQSCLIIMGLLAVDIALQAKARIVAERAPASSFQHLHQVAIQYPLAFGSTCIYRVYINSPSTHTFK